MNGFCLFLQAIERKRLITARLEQRRKVCENLPICRKTSGKFFERMGGIRDDRSHAST